MKNPQKMFSDILDRIAQESHCTRRKVACIAVRDNRIVATGINGTPKGCINCDDYFADKAYHKGSGYYESEEYRKEHHEWSMLEEIHAEQNLVCYAALNNICLKDCDIYCSLSPCISCTRLLAALKPKRVFYKEAYDKSDVVYISKYFGKIGIEFIKLDS